MAAAIPPSPGAGAPPARLGRYQIVSELGRGGMGAVYECVDPELDRRVAVKVLAAGGMGTPQARDAATRLRDEARAAARLRHPGLVTLVDTGEDPEAGPFLVYELMREGSLRRRLLRGPLPWNEALEQVARPLLGALEALHGAGITHRDVKPENLLADTEGGFRLADLGLALFSEREAKTATGIVYGTPGYLPPECYLDPSSIDPVQLDGYSAALTIIEAVAGRLPWSGSGQASVKEQLRWAPTDADLERLGVPAAAAARLAAALVADPRQRRARPAELLRDLEVLAAPPNLTPPGPRLSPVEPSRTRSSSLTGPGSELTRSLQGGPARAGSGRQVVAAVSLLVLATGGAWLAGRAESTHPPELGLPLPPPHERLVELARSLSAGPVPVAEFLAASRAFALDCVADPNPVQAEARWRKVLFELGSDQPTPSSNPPARLLLDACLEALLPGPDPAGTALPDPEGPADRLAAAVPILAWSSFQGDLGLEADFERMFQLRRRLRGGRGFRRAEPWTVLLWLATDLLGIEKAAHEGDLRELAGAAGAIDLLVSEPTLLPGHRTHLGAWLASLAERANRAARRLGSPLPADLAGRVEAWRMGSPGSSNPTREVAEALWTDSWDLAGRFQREATERDRDDVPEDVRIAWMLDWSVRAVWTCRAILGLADPILSPKLIRNCDNLLPIVHDWGTRHASMIRRKLEGRARYAMAGELTGRLILEVCEALAISARSLRGTRGGAPLEGIGALLEFQLVSIVTPWLGRLDPWERPSRAVLYQAIAPELVPGTLAARIVALRYALDSRGTLPPSEELLDLWDLARPDPQDPTIGLRLADSLPWGLFQIAAQAVNSSLKKQRRSDALGGRLARLDDAVARWRVPDGLFEVPNSLSQTILLWRADSALLGARSAEFERLRPRLEKLLSRQGEIWPDLAKTLLQGNPLQFDEP